MSTNKIQWLVVPANDDGRRQIGVMHVDDAAMTAGQGSWPIWRCGTGTQQVGTKVDGSMHLILMILRLLFGLDLDGSARPLPVAVRSDGRTHSHHGAEWLWNWLRECADWLRMRLFRPRPKGRARGRYRGNSRRGSAPPGGD